MKGTSPRAAAHSPDQPPDQPCRATPAASPYSILAPFYDHILGHFRKPFEDARDIVLRSRFPRRTGTFCDLASGTGTTCVQMAWRGWRAQGVDKAPAMVACAEEKRLRIQRAPAAVLNWFTTDDHRRLRRQTAAAAQARLRRPLHLQFLCADMRDFTLPEPADFMTCLFDSLNHLPHRRDLAPAFRAAARNLKPGGLFLFDLNSLRAVREIWPHMNPELHRNDQEGYWALVEGGPFEPQRCRSSVRWTWYIRQTAADPAAAPPAATDSSHAPRLSATGAFIPPTGKGWKKIEEQYFETGWTEAQIRTALKQAGLKMLWFVDANELTPGFVPGWRHFILAQRPATR